MELSEIQMFHLLKKRKKKTKERKKGFCCYFYLRIGSLDKILTFTVQRPNPYRTVQCGWKIHPVLYRLS
jgi:hypothetical protein